MLHDIAWRAMQVHGALGVSNEMPFFGMIHGAGVMGLADGPDRGPQGHRRPPGAARLQAGDEACGRPSGSPGSMEAARAKYAELLELEVGNL